LKRAGWVVCGGIAAWYLLSWAALRPLADAPVADSWLYGEAVRRYLQTGEIRFAGYTQAMPIVQVYYGAWWARWFGGGAASLEIADVVLAALGAMFFYGIARRSGASLTAAMLATGCLIGNPCYTFLSFSFMTEIPFLMLMLGACLAYAEASGRFESGWLWLAAIISLLCFLVRPFAAMMIVGFVGAELIFSAGFLNREHRDLRRLVRSLFPFAVVSAVCVAIWLFETVVNPRPWDLQVTLGHFAQLTDAPLANYVRAGVLGPLLYLGTVLSPMALMQLSGARRRAVIAWGVALFAATFILSRIDTRLPMSPEYSCFGGWDNVMILRGLPNRFYWNGGWQYFWMALGAAGAAGLVAAARDAIARIDRAAAALVIAALLYWAATIPLWFFNDRYYIVMVPAGCILLAIAPWPKSRFAPALAGALTLLMAALSLGGAYAYQRGIAAVSAVRDTLERNGVPRSAIDAGYSINGNDLYRYPKNGIDTMQLEAGIPMITSPGLDRYTIASGPIPGTKVIQRFEWPGPFGVGSRYLYVMRKVTAPSNNSGRAPAADAARPTQK
jgi:Dolichyl-phosphate-mannose-protein mannosyltransferase